MKTKKKGLQKFTDFESIQSMEDLLEFKKHHPKKMNELIGHLHKKIAEIAKSESKMEGEVDQYYKRLITVYEVEGRNSSNSLIKRERWNNNELLINNFMEDWLRKYRVVPTSAHIAQATGISRVTIQKHLKERKDHEYYHEQTEMLRGMTQSVLTELYRIGIQDRNVKALNGFLNYFSPARSSQPSQSNTQNNYIQINGMILSQENIKQLNPEQLQTIEGILKATLIQPVQEFRTITL